MREKWSNVGRFSCRTHGRLIVDERDDAAVVLAAEGLVRRDVREAAHAKHPDVGRGAIGAPRDFVQRAVIIPV